MRRITLLLSSLVISLTSFAEEPRWNLAELKQPPTMRWVSQAGAIRALLYQNEPYQEKTTEVFAFYASPATLSEQPDSKVNGVTKYPGWC